MNVLNLEGSKERMVEKKVRQTKVQKSLQLKMQSNMNKKENLLRKVTVKIRLERLDTQEEITVEALLDSGATGLIMSSEFTRKQGFQLKKIERPIYVRNMNKSLNKEGLIEHIVKVNIYY